MALKRYAILGSLLLLYGCALPQAAAVSPVTPATPAPLIQFQAVETKTVSPMDTPTAAAAAATSTPVSPTKTPGTPYPPTATPVPALDEAALRSATLILPETGPITLQDGQYSDGDVRVSLLTWGEGVLLYNGANDAVAAVSLNTGGSGNFVYLVAFINENGRPAQFGDAVFIEDRPQINKVFIWDARLVLDAVLHWADEPSCCPTKQVRLMYRMMAGRWQQERLITYTDEGAAHSITLARVAPENGTVQVYGLVSIPPFENHLVYRWYSADGQVLFDEGSLTIELNDSSQAGGPYFEVSVPPPPVPPHLDVMLRIMEFSMRDGSALTQASYWFTLP